MKTKVANGVDVSEELTAARRVLDEIQYKLSHADRRGNEQQTTKLIDARNLMAHVVMLLMEA